MATITIDVLNTSLTLTGDGPLTSAYDVSFDEPLSMCGAFSFAVPARDQRAALLTVQKSVVRIYEDGVAVFLGLVESRERAISAGGAVFRVAGRSYLAALSDQSVGFLLLASGAAGITDAPADVLAATSPTGLSSGWTLDTTNGVSVTANAVYGRMRGESRLSALVMIAERAGEGFIYRPGLAGSGDKKVIWLSSYAASGVRAIQGGGEALALEDNPYICLITSLTELEDGAELVNRLLPFGAGEDLENSAFTIAASTYTSLGTPGQPDNFAVYTSSGTGIIDWNYSISALGYRQREAVVQFQDIVPISNTDADHETAANMLAFAGMRWLEKYGIAHKFYDLAVTQLPSTVYAGTSVRVIYYEEDTDGTVLHDINTDLYVLNVATGYGNDGSKAYSLTVGTTDRFPTSEGEMVAARIEEGRIYGAYTQFGPNVDTIAYNDEFDDTTAARLDFWLGAEIAQVQQVLLRFRIDPLRSTVKSVGGSASVEVTIDTIAVDVSTSVSVSGTIDTRHDHAVPEHYHSTVIVDGSAFTLVANANLYTSGGIYYIGHEAGGSSHDVFTKLTGEGSTTAQTGGSASLALSGTGSGTGTGTGTGSGTTDLSSAITAEYGIFEDSGATVIDDSTLGNLQADIVMTVNGTDRTSSIVASAVSGWYELDVTAWVSDPDTYRPTAATHYISVIAAAGLRGRIAAQLQIRARIQAVAYT